MTIEQTLFAAADKMRGLMSAGEYSPNLTTEAVNIIIRQDEALAGEIR